MAVFAKSHTIWVAVLARGEDSNYINDYPKDLYIYNYSTKSSMPLISYDWFPSQAKYFLQEYEKKIKVEESQFYGQIFS